MELSPKLVKNPSLVKKVICQAETTIIITFDYVTIFVVKSSNDCLFDQNQMGGCVLGRMLISLVVVRERDNAAETCEGYH